MKFRASVTAIWNSQILATSIVKSTFFKSKPKIKFGRDYKHSNNDLFQTDPENSFRNFTNLRYGCFEDIFLKDFHATVKNKILEANENALTHFRAILPF